MANAPMSDVEFGMLIMTEPSPVQPTVLGDDDMATYVAGTALSGHRVVALDANTRAVYASYDDATALAVIGITVNAANALDNITVQKFGYMDWPAGGLTPNALLFLQEDGMLSHVPVTGPGYSRAVATAVAVNKIFIDRFDAYRLE